MPSASGTQHHPQPADTTEPHTTGPDPAADPVLIAEREHLAQARDFLRLMREDVLSLRALGGDRVSEEYLKADLYRRAEALSDMPDTPLFFGRLDYVAGEYAGDRFHVGRRHVHDPAGLPVVVDWRAPVSRAFYRASPAEPMGLGLRRRFGFAGGQLTAHEDEMLTGPDASPAEAGVSRILIEEIERPRSGPMRDIVATIQPDQDDIVRAAADQTLCVQGAPGTGKTAVGLHRVAYLLYAYPGKMTRGGVLVIGPNRAFLSYIRNVLPALGELTASARPRWPTCWPRFRSGPPNPPRRPGSRAIPGWPRCSAGRCGPGCAPQPSRCCWPAGPAAGGYRAPRSATWWPSCATAASATRPAGTCSATGSRT